MKILNRFLTFVSIVILISACSSLPEESTTNVQWEQHSAQLAKIEAFKASGKLAYRGPNETLGLNFHWNHSEESSELRLTNFLGSTVLKMTMTPMGSTVVTSDNDIFEDLDANILFSKLTGLFFPVAQMKYWIKGQPTQADSYTFNETNTLATLQKRTENRLWTLDYTRYIDQNSLPLPSQMTLTSTDIQIKIVVSKWAVNL